MSIAAGRGWLAAGQGLSNIGTLLLQQQELQRERQRQDLADKYAAEDQQMRRLAFQQQTGLNPDGTPTASQGVYSGGEYVPTLGKQLTPSVAPAPVAPVVPVTPAPAVPENTPSDLLPGMTSVPPSEVALPTVTTVPAKVSAPSPVLPAIGQIARGTSAPAGGSIPVGRSQAQRTADARLKQNASEADVLASNNPGFAERPWRERVTMAASPTLYNSFTSRQTREAAAADEATKAAQLHATATVARQRLGLPDTVDDKHAVDLWMAQTRSTNQQEVPRVQTLQQRMRARAEHLQQTLGSKSRISGRTTLAPWNDVIARMRQDGEFGNATSADWQAIGTPGATTSRVPNAGPSGDINLNAPRTAPVVGAGGKLSVTQSEYNDLARQYGADVAAQHYVVGP